MNLIREHEIRVVIDEEHLGERIRCFLTIELPHPTRAESLATHIGRWNLPDDQDPIPDYEKRNRRDRADLIANTTCMKLRAWLREIGAIG